jgi:hypothetical protein
MSTLLHLGLEKKESCMTQEEDIAENLPLEMLR